MRSSKPAGLYAGVECCVPLAVNPGFLRNRFHLQVVYAAAQKVDHCPAITEQATFGIGNRKLAKVTAKAKVESVEPTATDAANNALKY